MIEPLYHVEHRVGRKPDADNQQPFIVTDGGGMEQPVHRGPIGDQSLQLGHAANAEQEPGA